MKYVFLIFVFWGVGLLCIAQDLAFPRVDLDNGELHIGIFLPDTAKGYYRATRFDWAGVMPEVDYKGHRYVTLWFPKYGPRIHDAILGPVESFGPVGYGPAGFGAGDRFVQIGVGVLERPDTLKYNAFRYYPIVDAGKRVVKKRKRRVVFVQELEKMYTYAKEVVLERGKPSMRLVHHLKNTGSTVIETDVFDHNFFRMEESWASPTARS